MSEKLGLYKCEVCGNLVQVILAGVGELVCCGEPMTLLKPHYNDNQETSEKHVPVFVDKNDEGEEIRIGSTLHPTEHDHYIQFIEVISEDNKSLKLKYLTPGEAPIMELKEKATNEKAKAYCNIHGLWEGNKND